MFNTEVVMNGKRELQNDNALTLSEKNEINSIENLSNQRIQAIQKKSSHYRSRSDGYTLQIKPATVAADGENEGVKPISLSNSDFMRDEAGSSISVNSDFSANRRKRKISAPDAFLFYDHSRHENG